MPSQIKNPGAQNRYLAYARIFDDVMASKARTNCTCTGLYKDDAFKQAM